MLLAGSIVPVAIAILEEALVTTSSRAPNQSALHRNYSISNPVRSRGPKIIGSASRVGSCSGSAAERM
jgi:hypothetical protein